jgi:hypothetical protein
MPLLKDTNDHPRDARIRFDELPHKYYIDGCTDGYISCTTFIHTFFGHFDADSVIQNMVKSKNWKQSKYYGSTPDEIKAQWEIERDSASASGTKMHKNIELAYNNLSFSDGFVDSVEYSYFAKFKQEHPHLVPYRTEWEVFDEAHLIAGSIDMVFFNELTKAYDIYDWKRSKEIKRTAFGGKKGLYPLEEHDDCNFVQYSLQLNLYKNILERLYGLVIKDLCLVVIHPNQSGYRKIHVDAMQKQIGWILDERVRQNGLCDLNDVTAVHK